MSEFKLPDVGEGLTEAEIVEWKVAVGDVVKINDIIVDIETAKSIVELPSPFEGRVDSLLVAEGETVPVGTPIVAIGDPAETDSGGRVAEDVSIHGSSLAALDNRLGGSRSEPEAQEQPERQKVLVGYGPRTGATKRRVRKAVAAPSLSVATEAPRPVRALAKPPVRKLAKDLGVDLSTISVAGEVITRADVEAHANGSTVGRGFDTSAAQTPQPTAPSTSAGRVAEERGVSRPTATGDRRIPIKGVRKMTAEAMVSSAFSAPHVTEWLTLDVTPTMELVAELRSDRGFADVKVSPLLIVAKAVCLAMRRTPELNSTWDERAQEIVLKSTVNLGIAAATPRGLVVPNVVGAESLSLHDLAAAIGDLTATSREGRTQPAQMSGGSFTITNIGVFGIDAGTPILNPGEAGILALGAINKRPWVGEDDEIVARQVTTLALSFDHRVVDGEQGSRFLTDVAAILANPGRALTF